MAIRRPDLYEHNNPDLAIVDSDFTRGGNRTVADLTALYALSSKSDQLKQYVTRVFVQSSSKWYTLIDINNIGSSLGWAVDAAAGTLQEVTNNGATTTNAITTAGLTITGGNGLVTTSQFYASASNITNSIFVGYDSFAVYLGYQMGSVPVHIGTGGSGAIVFRNSGGFQVESLAGTGTRMMVVGSDGTVSTQSIPTNAVSSVFGRIGAVTAQSGDYTTAQVTEGGNLYYTDARSRAALSFSAGSGGYNSTTGVISIPTSSSNISEGSNLYFTEQRVRDSVLTGLNITGGSVVSTDSVLSAFGKIQNQINGLLGGSIFQSTWNASTNSPILTSSVGTKGHYYIVATAGSTNLDGITDWQVGDWAIFDGSVWRKVDNTDAVVSVNGFTGAVSLTTSNISEGSALYYTDARSRAAISVNNGAAAYNSGTGVITIPSTTAHISESGNLFYTDARSRAALSFSAGSGAYNSSTGVITIPTDNNQIGNSAGYVTQATADTRYILNQGTQQASSAFNISGNGTIGGNLAVTGTSTFTGVSRFNGNIGLNTAAGSTINLTVRGDITGSSTSLGQSNEGLVRSGVTSRATYSRSILRTEAASFNIGTASMYSSEVSSIGAGSTITNLIGFDVLSNFVGGTNTYGFRGQIPSGTGRWNLYMDGTADNHLSGNTLIGTTSNPNSRKLLVSGTGEITGATTLGSTLDVSGAVTILSSVTTGGFVSVVTNDQSTARILVQNTGTGGSQYAMMAGDNNVDQTGFSILKLGFGNILRFNSSNAATFASSVTATSFLESSDIRLKDVIKEMTSFTGIDTIVYNWKDRRDHLDHIGYSAQQVEEILPYAVSESNGYKTVDYNQVHTFKIMLLEDRILKLEDELKQYKNGVQ